MPRTIELIYFEGCPNAEAARVNLREALSTIDAPPHWQEWEQGNQASPAHAREFGSPTILVNGHDVTGVGPGAAAAACRADGAPSIEIIRNALEGVE
jgi:hypothetical protein